MSIRFEIESDPREGVRRAKAVIDTGGVIAFPTDTVYGVGCDYRDRRAVERIYLIKGRKREKPLILLGAHARDLHTFCAEPDDLVNRAFEHFWPGGVTFIVAKSAVVPDFVTDGRPTVGLRVPAFGFTRALLYKTGPLATTSANLSGEAPYTGRDEAMPPGVDALFAGGATPEGLASTIVDLSVRPPLVLREGGLSRDGFESWYATVR